MIKDQDKQHSKKDRPDVTRKCEKQFGAWFAELMEASFNTQQTLLSLRPWSLTMDVAFKAFYKCPQQLFALSPPVVAWPWNYPSKTGKAVRLKFLNTSDCLHRNIQCKTLDLAYKKATEVPMRRMPFRFDDTERRDQAVASPLTATPEFPSKMLQSVSNQVFIHK